MRWRDLLEAERNKYKGRIQVGEQTFEWELQWKDFAKRGAMTMVWREVKKPGETKGT